MPRIHLFKFGRAVRFEGDPFAFTKKTRHTNGRTLRLFVVGPYCLITVTGRV